MLTMELVIRDERGERVDPATLGVEQLVAAARAPGPPDGVGPPARAEAALRSLEAAEQLSRTVAAVRAGCVSAVGAQCPDGPAGERVLDELSCALLVSRRSATFTRNVAETLHAVPAAWAALARGDIDLTRARILADAALEIPRWDDQGAERPGYQTERETLLDDGLRYAAEHTARRLELHLRRRLADLGCPDRPRRRRAALAQRGVWITHDGDGTADLTARLASQDAERLYTTIRHAALADRNGDPHQNGQTREPMGLWMAAALVDLVLNPGLTTTRHNEGATPSAADTEHRAGRAGRGGTGESSGTGGRGSTIINVTIPIDSLAGLTNSPGILNGYGVVPADVARRLAAGDARWRHILTCRTTGALLDIGTMSHRPPAALDRHIRLRDGTCRFPGCTVPARECDLDHLIPFPTGPTSAENLHALCRRHHSLKHDGGWQVTSGPGHTLTWTSPQGATATTHPDDTLSRIA